MNNGNNPISPIVSAEGWLCCTGLTKREYFAAMAMQGLLSNSNYDIHEDGAFDFVAEDAISFADAILKQLEETSNPS
jgi:hypothetical protein